MKSVTAEARSSTKKRFSTFDERYKFMRIPDSSAAEVFFFLTVELLTCLDVSEKEAQLSEDRPRKEEEEPRTEADLKASARRHGSLRRRRQGSCLCCGVAEKVFYITLVKCGDDGGSRNFPGLLTSCNCCVIDAGKPLREFDQNNCG